MLTIQTFSINQQDSNLTLSLSDSSAQFSEEWQFSFEFLRVVQLPGRLSKKPTAIDSHKKSVLIVAIESLGRHGFKLLFDDGFSCSYHQEEFALLFQQRESLWQDYLVALKSSGHSREAIIDIKQL